MMVVLLAFVYRTHMATFLISISIRSSLLVEGAHQLRGWKAPQKKRMIGNIRLEDIDLVPAQDKL